MGKRTMKNNDWTELIRSGQQSRAIDEVYQHFPTIRAWIVKNSGAEEDARDIFQEGLLILCKKALQPEFELTCSPGTYLFSVCRHLWIDVLRKSKPTMSISTVSSPPVVDEESILRMREKEARYLAMDEILMKIGEKCQQLLRLFYLEKRSMKEIAKLFGFSGERSAKVQKYKCLKRAKALAQQASISPISQS